MVHFVLFSMSFCSGEKTENTSVSSECAESLVCCFVFKLQGEILHKFYIIFLLPVEAKDSFQSVLVVGFGQSSSPKKMPLVDGRKMKT